MDSLDSKYLAQLFVVSLTVKTSLSLVCVGVGVGVRVVRLEIVL